MLKYCSLMIARMMKNRRVNELLQEETSTVFDFFSTKCNLRETEMKRYIRQQERVTWRS